MDFIIFDVDGTLTNTYYADDDCYKRALDHVLPAHNLTNYWEGCAHATDSAVADFVFQRLFQRSPNASELEELQSTFVRLLQEKQQTTPRFFEEIPGAGKVLKTLQAKPQVVGVATGGWHRPAHFKLNTANIDLSGVHFIGSDDHFAKLDFTQALIDRTSAKLAVDFERIIYVGDSVYDFKTAQALGLEFIGIDHKEGGYLKEAGAPRIIKNYAQDWDEFWSYL